MPTRRIVVVALTLLFLNVRLAAQGVNPVALAPDQVTSTPVVAAAASTVDADAPPSLAPTMANAAVGVRVNASAAPVAPAPFQGSVGRNPAMMIVGGVALIVGSFLDDPARIIVMVSGAVIGIYGLWQYLK